MNHKTDWTELNIPWQAKNTQMCILIVHLAVCFESNFEDIFWSGMTFFMKTLSAYLLGDFNFHFGIHLEQLAAQFID